jgi:4-hydroxy-2-oxoheptanedioate aldolase
MPTLARLFSLAAGAAAFVCAQNTEAPKPKRINRAIEMLEMGQPIYYTQYAPNPGAAGVMSPYETGKKMAQTPADYITYEMEHGSLDFTALRAFMRGLVDGGPTKTGHRTPAVIVTLPILGLDEAHMKANLWVVQQTLASGVHGILLCHARSPEAVRVLVEASRYPFAEPKAAGVGQGLRGSGSQGFAAQIWGISGNEYMRRADTWPLNKEGEIMLGLKIEDSYALANAEKVSKVPGIAFAEWGPGDMGFWLLGRPGGGGGGGRGGAAGGRGGGAGNIEQAPVMQQARARVLKATKDAKIFFLNSCSDNTVEQMIKDGVMICTGGYNVGRKITKNPWTY